MGTGGSASLGLPLIPIHIARAVTTSSSTTVAVGAVAVLKEE